MPLDGTGQETLKAQYESGRLFPMYQTDRLVDAVEMYVRLTGNPMWPKEPPAEARACVERYRQSWDPLDLSPLPGLLKGISDLDVSVSRYSSPENRTLGLTIRSSNGLPDTGRGVRGKFLLISEVEAFVPAAVPTKVPDLAPVHTGQGNQARTLGDADFATQARSGGRAWRDRLGPHDDLLRRGG